VSGWGDLDAHFFSRAYLAPTCSDEVSKLKEKSKHENISADGLAKLESFVQGVSTTMTEVVPSAPRSASDHARGAAQKPGSQHA